MGLIPTYMGAQPFLIPTQCETSPHTCIPTFLYFHKHQIVARREDSKL